MQPSQKFSIMWGFLVPFKGSLGYPRLHLRKKGENQRHRVNVHQIYTQWLWWKWFCHPENLSHFSGNLENQIFYGAVTLKLTMASEARFKALKALRHSCPPLLNFLCLLNIVHYKIWITIKKRSYYEKSHSTFLSVFGWAVDCFIVVCTVNLCFHECIL